MKWIKSLFRKKGGIVSEEPKMLHYEIVLKDNKYFITRHLGASWAYMRCSEGDSLDFKRDHEIWYNYGIIWWGESPTRWFNSQESAKEFLDYYLSGEWKKPIYEVVYKSTPILPT